MNKLREMLKRHEGEKKRGKVHIMYKCGAGYNTGGYGHNIDMHGFSQATADLWLTEDTDRAKREVATLMDYYGISAWRLNVARKDVLIDMAFCMGMKDLGGFVKMWAALQEDNFEKAADEIVDSKFGRSKFHKKRALELREIMRKGAYSS